MDAQTRDAALHVLSELVHSPDEELLNDACSALGFAATHGADAVRRILEAGCTRRVLELCLHPSDIVRSHAVGSGDVRMLLFEVVTIIVVRRST